MSNGSGSAAMNSAKTIGFSNLQTWFAWALCGVAAITGCASGASEKFAKQVTSSVEKSFSSDQNLPKKVQGAFRVEYSIERDGDGLIVLSFNSSSPHGTPDNVQYQFRNESGSLLVGVKGERQAQERAVDSFKVAPDVWRFDPVLIGESGRMIVLIWAEVDGREVSKTLSIPISNDKQVPPATCQSGQSCLHLLKGMLVVEEN